MHILAIILILAVIGFILYLVNTYIPMPDIFRKVLNVVAVILVIIWLLHALGFWGYLRSV